MVAIHPTLLIFVVSLLLELAQYLKSPLPRFQRASPSTSLDKKNEFIEFIKPNTNIHKIIVNRKVYFY